MFMKLSTLVVAKLVLAKGGPRTKNAETKLVWGTVFVVQKWSGCKQNWSHPNKSKNVETKLVLQDI